MKELRDGNCIEGVSGMYNIRGTMNELIIIEPGIEASMESSSAPLSSII